MSNETDIKVKVGLTASPQDLLNGTFMYEAGVPILLLERDVYPGFTAAANVASIGFVEAIPYPGPQWMLRCDALKAGFPFPV